MNSRTSPTSAQGGRALPVAIPISLVTPGWPSLRPPFCLWGSSSLPLLPPPFPPRPGPWDGRSRGRGFWGGIRFRGQMEEGRLSAGVSSRERPTAVATAGSVTVGWGGSRPSLRKPGKWVGGRGKVVTGSGEPRRSKAHTFQGILGYSRSGGHPLFLTKGVIDERRRFGVNSLSVGCWEK